MRNIHVLPTDKPSRLYSKDGNHILDTTMAIDWYISSAGYKPHNIYITSDEEIKARDWVLFENSNVVRKAVDSTFTSGVNNIRIHADKKVFKIILTTDGDLIKDGVQAIDDEFLEWFVKNPSCEKVEVIEQELNTDYRSDWEQKFYYKIIIPKEEQKQHLIDMMKSDEELGLYEENTKCYCGHTTYCDCGPEEPKQENCCSPIGHIKRYIDCVGCDRKPKQHVDLIKSNEEVMTAEDFFRKKLKELNPLQTVITLSGELITAEQGMRWAKEYSDYISK